MPEPRIRRALWRLRIAFHDWMWSGRSLPKRLAQRLPLYFSDPYWMDRSTIAAIFARSTVARTQHFVVVEPSNTATSGGSMITFRYTYDA